MTTTFSQDKVISATRSGNVVFDIKDMKVTKNGKVIDLTKENFSLMDYFELLRDDKSAALEDYANMIVEAGKTASKLCEQYYKILDINKEYKDREILFYDEFDVLQEVIFGTEHFLLSTVGNLSEIYGLIKKIELSGMILNE